MWKAQAYGGNLGGGDNVALVVFVLSLLLKICPQPTNCRGNSDRPHWEAKTIYFQSYPISCPPSPFILDLLLSALSPKVYLQNEHSLNDPGLLGPSRPLHYHWPTLFNLNGLFHFCTTDPLHMLLLCLGNLPLLPSPMPSYYRILTVP